MEKQRIDVMYRLDTDGEALAIFPYDVDVSGKVGCYAHYGQHSVCSVEYYRKLKKCPAEKVQELRDELVSIGYEPKEVSRFSHRRYRDAYRDSMSNVLNNI